MKLGDMVYSDDRITGLQRGDLVQLLVDCVQAITPDSQRRSNGNAADALFNALDAIGKTAKHEAAVRQVLDDYFEEDDDDDEDQPNPNAALDEHVKGVDR